MTKIVFAVIVCGVSYERLTAEEKVGYDAMRSRMSPRFAHNAQKKVCDHVTASGYSSSIGGRRDV